ncbi:MOSC domain-containing protein [Paenibacillus sp. TAF58]
MEIVSINIGKPNTIIYQGKELVTGIYKSPVSSPLYVGGTNLDGDGQADLKYHGGVDKALCVYCDEHYAYWENVMERKLDYGAFGENLTVRGLLETDVCIGDTYQLGEAIVQVTQPRQPCHKLAKRHDMLDLPVQVQHTGYTGYYFRVLQEGIIDEHSTVKLIEKQPAGITVDYANQIKFHDKSNMEGVKRILAVKELSASWRESFEQRLQELEG